MMIKSIQQEYNQLTEKEKKIFQFGMKMILTETSKFLILIIFFLLIEKPIAFLFCTIILLPLRCNIGGIHLHTYWGCLAGTFIIYINAILILPQLIKLSTTTANLLLAICLIINLIVGPVINPTRPPLTKENVKQIKTNVIIIFLLYTLLINLFDINNYTICGIWIIAEQTLQLLIAKIQRNGEPL